MFYLIGIGLNLNSISAEALEALAKCNKVYLENYTVDFPYNIKDLGKSIGKEIIELNREKVESEKFLEDAKKEDIALLVYGDALSATTHISLILKCKNAKIKYKIFHNASVLTAVSETGLQLYKFGKTASMPAWQKNYEPDSFIEIVLNNQKIKAHSLILIDIGLELKKAKEQLKKSAEKHGLKLDKIIVCSELGIENKIIYNKLDQLPDSIKQPFCFVIPSDLHFTEKEFLEQL
ncbi:MAG: diphthine synthase [Nanoarchaeota archaeon]|nr:diphthine synthase [Nanoarchaeota archaeon]